MISVRCRAPRELGQGLGLGLGPVALALVIAATGCKTSTPLYCESNTDCSTVAGRPACDTAQRVCVTIAPDLLPPPDLAMGDEGPVAMNDLLEPAPRCTSSSECTAAGAPVCGATGVCEGCKSDLDDVLCAQKGGASKRCQIGGATAGQCVACRSAMPNRQTADCGDAQPICTAAGSCALCASHAECDSGVCLDSGACAKPGDIAYVDGTGACVDALHDSMPPGMPYCEVSAAITVSQKAVVKVKGKATPYKGISMNDPTTASGSVFVVGPGASASPTARIFKAAGSPAVELSFDSSATADYHLIFDGVEIGGTNAERADNAILCTNNKAGRVLEVGLRRALVHFSTAAAIASTKCTVTLDGAEVTAAGADGIDASGGGLSAVRSRVHDNTSAGIVTSAGAKTTVQQCALTKNGQAGLSIGAADYLVENTLIAKNGGTGLVFDGTVPSPTSRIWFDTIVRNGPSGVEGGINWGALTGSDVRAVSASIIALNSATDTTPTQLAGKCAWSSVAVGPAETSSATGLIKQTPAFFDSNPTMTTVDKLLEAFSLTAADTVARDVLDMAVGFPPVDVFGTMRPQGGKFDLGAHELVP